MRFTRQSVEALTIPPGKPYHIEWDESLKGFGVRVNPTNKQWVVQYRAGGKSRRETIGRVDAVSLDDARRRARASIAKAQLGGDPQAEKAQERAKAALTFGAVVPRYLDGIKRRLRGRTYEEAERYLNRHWGPLAPLPLHKVTRATVAARLGELAGENGPSAANRARAALSAFFSWAMGEGLAEANPVVGTNKAGDETPRDRVLSDLELAAIWGACRDDDYGRIVRLLMLTGQRREEVGGLAWGELVTKPPELALWALPAERAKNGRAHLVPLSGPAVAVLEAAPRREGRALVFGEGSGGFSGWSKAKAAMDARIAASGAKVEPWTLHDLRRTAATRLADLGTLPHVVEAILNHVSGHKAGVAGIYNRATYSAEKRQALDRWGEYVLTLVDGKANDVATLATGGRQ